MFKAWENYLLNILIHVECALIFFFSPKRVPIVGALFLLRMGTVLRKPEIEEVFE